MFLGFTEGNIALVLRGDCTFVEKVEMAEKCFFFNHAYY